MRKRLPTMLVIGVVSFVSVASAAPPNIIVVMGDDHAQWATGAYGLAELDTPNIDWLADHGVMFRNAFTPAPVCSSARASFHTGKMPSQHGVHDFLSELPEFDGDWLAGETLLSERLQTLGYTTALLGKWHATSDSRPPQRGFDRWLSYDAFRDGWQNQYQHSGTVHFSSDGDYVQHTGVQARYLTEEAIRFIDASGAVPFFISLNFTEPHWPFDGLPERLVDRYRPMSDDIIRAGGFSDLPARGENTLVPDSHGEQLAHYLAAVSLIDEQLGRLLDALQGRNLLDDTIVIYTSDHGLLMGQYGLYGKTNASFPSNFYEETIRIPMVVLAPKAMMRPRQTRDEMVDLLDLHTTVLDFASEGAHASTTEYGPGKSLRPLLAGERDSSWRQLQFAERGRARMVSDGRFKLVRTYRRSGDDGPTPPVDRWYDLAHPMGERVTTPPPRRALEDELIAELESFFARYETETFTGRTLWNQHPPNARVKREIEADAYR